MRTLIVLIPARREGSETATRSGDNTRATTDNQHFTCRSQSPAPDSSAPRPQDTGEPNPLKSYTSATQPTVILPHPERAPSPRKNEPRDPTPSDRIPPSRTTHQPPTGPLNNQPPNHRATPPRRPIPLCKSIAYHTRNHRCESVTRAGHKLPCKSIARLRRAGLANSSPASPAS